MRTTKLVLALLTSVAIAPSAFAQMNKHDSSIATYNYNIAISEDDNASTNLPLNVELDKGLIDENAPVQTAPAMPAPMAGQGQAPLTPYQDIQPAAPASGYSASRSGAPQMMGSSDASMKEVLAPAQAIQIGAAAPDFILPNATGNAVGLKDILAKGPAVILFTRGSSCAFCVTQMQLLQKNQQQFAALGIQTIAVSPEPLDSIMRAQQRFGVSYPVLGDMNSQVARTYGLVTARGAAAPALVTIDASGKVADVQIQQPGVGVFNLTKATSPLRMKTAVAPVAVPTSKATAVPSTQVAPQATQPNAMPPVPSPQAGKVKFDVPPSNPNFGKIDETKSIAI